MIFDESNLVLFVDEDCFFFVEQDEDEEEDEDEKR
jgi:hypothetical protein